MSDSFTSYETTDGIATIVMDDGKANALSTQMITELGEALNQAESEAKAVVLQGRDGKFSAGFDLRQMMAGPASAAPLVKAGGELLMRLYTFPKPVVVACTGHALAAGVLLAATGDSRIGALGAFKIGLNEVQNGMPVPIFAHEIAQDRLLPTERFDAVVKAKLYDPEGAVRAGWLDRAVAPDQVAAEALAEAKRLSKLPQPAFGLTKQSLRKTLVDHVRATLDSNIDTLLRSLAP